MTRRSLADAASWVSALPLLSFTLVIALASLVARLLLVPLFLLFETEAPAPISMGETGPWLVLLVGPVVETLLFQALPIRLASALRAPRWLQIVISTVVFSLAHLPGGVVSAAVAVTGGLAFAWAFIRWSEVSIGKGLVATVLTHCWVNAGVGLIAFLALGVAPPELLPT